jgi:hypothetical protein
MHDIEHKVISAVFHLNATLLLKVKNSYMFRLEVIIIRFRMKKIKRKIYNTLISTVSFFIG